MYKLADFHHNSYSYMLAILISCHAPAQNTFQPLIKTLIKISDCYPGKASNRYRTAVKYLLWSGCRPVRCTQHFGLWNVELNNYARTMIGGLTEVHVEWEGSIFQNQRLPRAAETEQFPTVQYNICHAGGLRNCVHCATSCHRAETSVHCNYSHIAPTPNIAHQN